MHLIGDLLAARLVVNRMLIDRGPLYSIPTWLEPWTESTQHVIVSRLLYFHIMLCPLEGAGARMNHTDDQTDKVE